MFLKKGCVCQLKSYNDLYNLCVTSTVYTYLFCYLKLPERKDVQVIASRKPLILSNLFLFGV